MLVLLVVAVGLVGAWGLLGARREARREIEREIRWETEVRAQAVAAVLASLRGDFLFLVQTPPLRDLSTTFADPDPLRRRWSRIDTEASLLLFVEAHPEVTRLAVRRGDELLVAVGRRDGVPTLLDPGASEALMTGWSAGGSLPGAAAVDATRRTTSPDGETLRGEWPIDETTVLVTHVSLPALLAAAAPGSGDPRGYLSMVSPNAAALGTVPPSGLAAVPTDDSGQRALVAVPSWSPPVELALLHSNPDAVRADAFSRLAARFRATYGLLLVLAAIALAFGILAFREVGRAAALEAHRAQEARIRELERQVFHADRLASVGRLAAGLAHEINNPLEGMSNYLALLRDELPGERGPAREYLEKTEQGLRRIAGVTREVLAFSDPGRAPRASVDLHAVVTEAVSFLRTKPIPGTTAIEVEEPTLPLNVQGNPVTLGQLFLNLLLNAAEATAGAFAPNGAVGPWAGIRVGLAREGEEAVVTVRDHGPGIDPDHLDKIFEPFFSGRGSTGLGLSVCYGIVQDHGGAIRAANHRDGGAVFTVRLPLEAPARA